MPFPEKKIVCMCVRVCIHTPKENLLIRRWSPVTAVLERKNQLPGFGVQPGLWLWLGSFDISVSLPTFASFWFCARSSAGERSWIPQAISIWVFYLPRERAALTCSPEGAGTWWFLIWGKWGEIDAKKQPPTPHCSQCWHMLQLDLFSCTSFAVLLAICSRVLEIVTPSETFGIVVFSVNQLWMVFVSFLVITTGAQKTLWLVHPVSHPRVLCH